VVESGTRPETTERIAIYALAIVALKSVVVCFDSTREDKSDAERAVQRWSEPVANACDASERDVRWEEIGRANVPSIAQEKTRVLAKAEEGKHHEPKGISAKGWKQSY
jgi:hypothetical protein